MSEGRKLTPGELALAVSVYGGSIKNYGSIDIHNHSYWLTPGQISAPNGDIYYFSGSNMYSDVISQLSTTAKGTFIHELMHVYQYQSG